MERVGIIIPSSNVVVEDALHTATGGSLDAAVQRLAEAPLDRIVFAGTAGAWLGIDHDRDWVARTEAATGLPATTTTLQTLEALARLRPDKLGLITPFVEEVHARIMDSFAAELKALNEFIMLPIRSMNA